MPLRLEIKRQLNASSERVKCVDIHPQEPWLLAALYSGHCCIWNYETQSLIKTFEVCDLPIRCARFIPKKQWIICGSDDGMLNVFNYNTKEKIKSFEAHLDYIRSLAVHPTKTLILSSSDDFTIKMWDWDKDWKNITVFEGHMHYVMQVEFNPKDTNTFASASLDRTVKVWGINSQIPHFTLNGHDKGVNCVGYFRGGDMPYLLSGADDFTVKIWDYQTKTCVATLTGHENNVSAVMFHPQLPIIISGSEDGTVRIWHSTTHKPENTLNYGMGRIWALSNLPHSTKVGIGYDDGAVLISLGNDSPVATMEEKGSKIVWARHQEILTANVQKVADVPDGEVLSVAVKELGSCEMYPQSIKHSPNGRLLAICGEGEYVIYTALKLNNKTFGKALEFVWAQENGVYATRESSSKVCVFKNFTEHKQFRPSFPAEGIFGGSLLGVRSADSVSFYDWFSCSIIRKIEVCPKTIYWSESGETVVIACDGIFYVLGYNSELVEKFLSQNMEVNEQGIDGAFELEKEITETVETGHFIGDCFIYTTSNNRLNYYVGGQVMTLAHLEKPMNVLGYSPKNNRVYLMDKQNNIISYMLLVSVLIYQTAIVREDFERAEKALDEIPIEHHAKIAQFLEAHDHKELALKVSPDPDHKFELAIGIGDYKTAKEVLVESETSSKWKQLGDVCLNEAFDLKMAEECYMKSNDLGGLLLIYSSLGDVKGMEKLIEKSIKMGRNNIAFIGLLLLGRVKDCIELLCNTERIPEAAFMARTYAPSEISNILKLWKENLRSVSEKAADSLADPTQYPDKFPDLKLAYDVEKWSKNASKISRLASKYLEFKDDIRRNLLEELNEGKLNYAEKEPPLKETETPVEVQSETKNTEKIETPKPISPKVNKEITPQEKEEDISVPQQKPSEAKQDPETDVFDFTSNNEAAGTHNEEINFEVDEAAENNNNEPENDSNTFPDFEVENEEKNEILEDAATPRKDSEIVKQKHEKVESPKPVKDEFDFENDDDLLGTPKNDEDEINLDGDDDFDKQLEELDDSNWDF